MKKIFRLGITGPTGAGKGMLSGILSEALEISVMDADRIYHSILENDSGCRDELILNFGGGVIRDGRIDRKALAGIVFAPGAEEKLLLLNSITHKYVKEKIEQLISEEEQKGAFAVIIDAPLLIESGIHLTCDKVICVLASERVREERIIERDRISREQARARIAKQKSDGFYTDVCDIAIYNDGSEKELTESAFRAARELGLMKGEGDEGIT